ncbi:MAG: carbohydrate binding domain-containing protein, partial [Nanoarchaeota archaeon]
DSNLLVDASFEEDSGEWSGDGSITESDSYLGDFSLELEGSGLDKNVSIDPEQGYSKQGEKYTFSFYAKNCNSGDKYGIVNSKEDLSSMEGGDDWQKYTYSHAFAEDESNEKIINIKIDMKQYLYHIKQQNI